MGLPVNCTSKELSTYLLALEEGYLPTFCSIITPSVPSRSMSIASKSYQQGSETDRSRGSPSLPMSKNLTANHGKDSLTLLRVASHAKTSAQQAEVQESKEQNRASGPNLLASFARFDRDTCSWKIPQCSLLGDSEPLSETWPQWGMWDAGACWELPTLVPRISGNGSGLWPTPVAHDDGKTPEAHMRMKENMPGGKRHKPTSLQVMAKGLAKGMFSEYLPTPTATNARQGANSKAGGSGAGIPLLPMAATTWPTPTTQDAKNNGSQSQQARNSKPLNAEVGGSLSPDWVEWLMGWPIGFTALEPLEHSDPHPWDNEPDIPRISKGVKNRAKRLQAIGNGQVPQCAAAAWRLLMQA